MKKVDINVVIMLVVGILIGFCVTYCTISFMDSYKKLTGKVGNKQDSYEDNYVIYFDDKDSENDIEEKDESNNSIITNNDVNNNVLTSNDSINNNVSNNNQVNSDFATVYNDPVSFFENVSNSNDENILKNGFVSIVDFIFYEKEIGGYTFKGLTNEAKLKVMNFALVIDQKIESYFPGYKESISNGVKTIYSNVKGFIVELYLDTVTVICDNNESFCENAKNDFQVMKKSFGLTWDFIKSYAEAGADKIKNWYEVFRD